RHGRRSIEPRGGPGAVRAAVSGVPREGGKGVRRIDGLRRNSRQQPSMSGQKKPEGQQVGFCFHVWLVAQQAIHAVPGTDLTKKRKNLPGGPLLVVGSRWFVDDPPAREASHAAAFGVR